MRITGLFIFSFWLLLLFVITTKFTGSLGYHGFESVAFAQELEGKTTGQVEGQGFESKTRSLTLQDYIQLVREKNDRIIIQQLEMEISSEMVKNARSIFEHEFVGSFQRESNHVKNTVEESLSLGWSNEYEDLNVDYNAALEGLVPTGGRLSLAYSLRDISNSLQSPGEEEYKGFFGATFTQPLLKNGGVKATMANIHVAEADRDVAFHTYRQGMMEVVATAASAYWDLYLAQEEYKMRRESVRIAEQILKDNRVRVKTGKMAETEVLDAEAGLAERKSLESAARQEIIHSMNNVRNLIFTSTAESTITIVAADRLQIDRIVSDFDKSLQSGLKLRPDYLSSKIKAEKEGVRIAYARNQRWPQLDLKASYGLNGLGITAGDSWNDLDREYDSWAVGFEMRIPLVGGIKSSSELRAAKNRKKQELLKLKAIEVALANIVDTSIRNVQSIKEQANYYKEAVDNNKLLLDVEFKRLHRGKSNSRLVLEREESLNNALENELESLVKHKKAFLELEMAEGTLLKRYGIEIIEEGK